MSVKEQFYNQRPAVLFDPRASQRIDPRFKFTRDGAASYIDRDGVLQVNGAPANQPRVGFNYEPDSDGVPQLVQGITVEEQRTNLLLRSEEFDNARWAKIALSITPNSIISPGGSLTADKLVEGTTLALKSLAIFDIPVTANQSYTFSAFFKKSERTAVRFRFSSYQGAFKEQFTTFDLLNKSVISSNNQRSKIENVGGGWYRCSAC
jgi:hypothetical protein